MSVNANAQKTKKPALFRSFRDKPAGNQYTKRFLAFASLSIPVKLEALMAATRVTTREIVAFLLAAAIIGFTLVGQRWRSSSLS